MTDLIAIVAPRGPLDGVRDALQDLSAVGLVEPFHWVPAESVQAGSIPATRVDRGRASSTTLQDVAISSGADRVRVVALTAIVNGAEPSDADAEQRVAELLEGSMHAARVVRTRVVVTRAGDPTTGVVARSGWHNIVLAPEQSAGPRLGHALLGQDDDVIAIARQAAIDLAGLVGLWQGMSESVLDEFPPEPGEAARLSRSYFRRLQGSQLESELRRRVTDTTTIPLPIDGGTPGVYAEDAGLAASNMAKQVVERHRDKFRGPRDSLPPNAGPESIGPLKALKMLFEFLWNSIKNAPMEWVKKTIIGIKVGVASRVTDVVFGSDPSTFRVVVGGMTARGIPASWIDTVDSVGVLEKRLEEAGVSTPEHHVARDFSALWKDYAAGALSLLDAGQHEGLEPTQIGGRRAVLRRAAASVPGPDDKFSGIPPHLAAHIEVAQVQAFDMLATKNAYDRLSQAQDDQSLGVAASNAIEDLKAWSAKHRTSYATRIASAIAEAFRTTNDEIADILTKLRDLTQGADVPDAILARQKKLAWVLRILGILLVVGLVVVGVLLGLAVIALTAALITIGALLVGWVASSVIAFLVGQRDLFRLKHRLESLVAERPVLERNLVFALRDLRHLGDAYRQFLTWSRILSVELSSPFGAVPELRDDGTRLSADLPMSVRLGSAQVSSDAIDDAVVQLRRQLFPVGWLVANWKALIESAPAALGPEARELRADPDKIFVERAEEGGLLGRWAAIVESEGVPAGTAEELWTPLRTQFDLGAGELGSRLLGSIVPLGGSARDAMTYEAFMSGIDVDDADPRPFDAAVFATQYQASADRRVDKSWARVQQTGLSRLALLTQLSQTTSAYYFAAYRPDGSGAQSAPRDDADF